jgi:flavin reductase (DIM6/NTAB) family NADH-FMN oxidoreductase RutF
MAISPERFRKTLSKFATGVTIITLKNRDGVHGLTVNAFSAVSLEPPLVLICIQKDGASHSFLSQAEHFVVNILAEDQKDLADRFASSRFSSEERFQGLRCGATKQGIPILHNTLGYLECRVVNEVDAGDHTVFFGEVEQAETYQGNGPLLFYDSQYRRL